MDYFKNPAMSQSKLKDLKKSPKHFFVKHLAEDRKEPEPTDAMKFGTAVHMCLFEPTKFNSTYVIDIDVDKRTKEGKAALAEFIKNNAGKIILSGDELIKIKRIRNSILNKKVSKILFNNKGLAEHELYWKDCGVNCKAKLDFFIEPCETFNNGLIVDLKTTINAEAKEFAKSVHNFGYHNQMAWYCKGVKEIYKTNGYPTFIFLPVEKIDPFECAFFAADQAMLKFGLQENEKLLNTYINCFESNNWFGYEDKVQEIGLPVWALNN